MCQVRGKCQEETYFRSREQYLQRQQCSCIFEKCHLIEWERVGNGVPNGKGNSSHAIVFWGNYRATTGCHWGSDIICDMF